MGPVFLQPLCCDTEAPRGEGSGGHKHWVTTLCFVRSPPFLSPQFFIKCIHKVFLFFPLLSIYVFMYFIYILCVVVFIVCDMWEFEVHTGMHDVFQDRHYWSQRPFSRRKFLNFCGRRPLAAEIGAVKMWLARPAAIFPIFRPLYRPGMYFQKDTCYMFLLLLLYLFICVLRCTLNPLLIYG